MVMFDYLKAFSRNIGWLTESEQLTIQSKKVAIAGAGGVGFEHAVTLARLGIEKFVISDFDSFEIHNINRQAGAFQSTMNKPKVEVLQQVLKDINPNCSIEVFPHGVSIDNLPEFLSDVDIYIDSLDFFVIDIRIQVFNYCGTHGIPAVTAAPLGMGTSVISFTPKSMSFGDYFDIQESDSENEKCLKFLVGLSPTMLQKSYLVVPEAANFKEKRGPSTPMAVKLCAGVAATTALKILLGRGEVLTAPKGVHFDAYRNKLKITNLRKGNRGLLQKLTLKIARNIVLDS